jgi:hypothetical protein
LALVGDTTPESTVRRVSVGDGERWFQVISSRVGSRVGSSDGGGGYR